MSIDQEVKRRIDILIDAHDEFNSEVFKAGGASFSLKRLKDMSALDLLCGLAPNNLKIKYDPPKDDIDF